MIVAEVETRFYSLLEGQADRIIGIFVGHGHLFVEDTLFDKIKVFETGSFGEDTDLPHLIVGFDTTVQTINVGKMQIE